MPFTSRGVGLLITVPVLLVTGFRFGYPELTVLGCAALVALLGAAGYAAWRPRPLVERSAEPDRVTRGEPSQVTLTVRRSGWFGGGAFTGYDRCGAAKIAIPPVRLKRSGSTAVTYPVPTDRRGVVAIGPLRVIRRDPLGLVELFRRHGATGQVMVYPRSFPLSAAPLGTARSLDGQADRVPHGSITFDSLREYVVGDDLRRVHWRTTARVGELMVREHVDTSRPRLVILLDDRRTVYPTPNDFESACEAAASVIALAQREDLPVRLMLASFPTGEESGGARGRLDALARADLTDADLALAVRRLRGRTPGDTLVFLTGAGGASDIAALTGSYPSTMAVVFGVWPEAVTTRLSGLLVVNARNGPDFARVWDGAGSW
jgi:uncharacterized protein (DUF58 family)